MNAVEIEAAVSELAEAPFDAVEFPYSFLAAFGNKDTTIARLRSGNTNKSDISGAVLQTNNIHIATCALGEVGATLQALKASPKTATAKAKFILATDGITLEAEGLVTGLGETVATAYTDLPKHFGFFLPLAGITTIAEIKNNAIDVRATGRLNRLYVELLKENPDWAGDARRHEMNHFMARLIFCFFAEDTGIFRGTSLFTGTINTMSDRESSNTHTVIETIFRAMNMRVEDRAVAKLPNWVANFPYVNGGLFADKTDVPRFSKIARTYLLHAGGLSWNEINPDIFGSMIQAVADEGERGALGMHYTSVPNILKVLNPLFLDELRAQLEAADDSKPKLLNLRRRIARIRVFDPACGSGNFLVIAYKQLRAIEAEINERRGEKGRQTEMHLTNFRGIELRNFPAEIARLALIIAEYQCDVLHRGLPDALLEFLPLDSKNWITNDNALRLDWLKLMDVEGTGVRLISNDLLETPLEQAEVEFEHSEGETFICGNPPYLGSTWQTAQQKAELQTIFDGRTKSWKSLDYVSGWFMKAADFCARADAAAAFVSTNSICQGQQVPILWPLIFATGSEITFAHTSFKWANLATHNAGVTVAIIGISRQPGKVRRIFSTNSAGEVAIKEVAHINAYLVSGGDVIVEKRSRPDAQLAAMDFGNKPVDGGNLLLTRHEVEALGLTPAQREKFTRRIYGAAEFIRGQDLFCLWINDDEVKVAEAIPAIKTRIDAVRAMRLESTKAATVESATAAHRFGEVRQQADETVIIVPIHTSENREYLPVGLFPPGTTVTNAVLALYDAPVWNIALLASRLHLVWIATICGKIKTDFRYSNTMGWNTFPVPKFTEQDVIDLTRCAVDILLAREVHFPATIADLYDPDAMPENLRRAHARNDEVLERIYIGRRFRNDTERLEKLFDLYTKMSAGSTAGATRKSPRKTVQ
ncbi:MAG: class I SAM-dependent DNA methyltransferase [Achromobacter sp.]|uniref:class I SAM-dependent DNA methyltransferase n=1 Tax=Achromobacter sp. TaxID=134375 RepID=UPI0012C89B08|nr:DNA methyltransferase [Achromobacter sp.]MPS79717.1 class I SAM-dependent DNA methyltransferase [Achromobacter sp.]